MASLIDTTYFQNNDISLPIENDDVLKSRIENAITRYEDEILKDLLGYSLWKDFKAGLAEDTVLEKWTDLKNGKEFSFEFYGETINTKWEGLVNSSKISLLAYYVYFQYRKFNETQYSGLNEQMSKSENANTADFSAKMIYAQNRMVDLYGKIPVFYKKYYSFIDPEKYIHYDPEPSAYNFLLANKDVYANWRFKPIGKLNTFGL